jgi:hypothetical protein
MTENDAPTIEATPEVAAFFDAKDVMSDAEQAYFTAAQEVANARILLAQEFAYARLAGATTDKQAEMQAIEKTLSALDVRLAELKIYEHRLLKE